MEGVRSSLIALGGVSIKGNSVSSLPILGCRSTERDKQGKRRLATPTNVGWDPVAVRLLRTCK